MTTILATKGSLLSDNAIIPLGYRTVEYFSGRTKTGDGVTRYSLLPYDDEVALKGETGATGPPGADGQPGPGGAVTLVASASLPAFVAVTITGDRADSSNTAHFGKVTGVTMAAIAIGFSGAVAVNSYLTNALWSWSAGSSIFLNGTALSMTPPSVGFSQVIGVAKSSDTLLVSLSDPVLL